MAALGAEARAELLELRGDPEAAAAGLAAALGLGAYRTAPREAAVVDLYVQAAECAACPSPPPPARPPARGRAPRFCPIGACMSESSGRCSAGTRVSRDARGHD